MRVCSTCGKPSPDTGRFCGNCGAALSEATPRENAPSESENPQADLSGTFEGRLLRFLLFLLTCAGVLYFLVEGELSSPSAPSPASHVDGFSPDKWENPWTKK